MGEPCGSQFAIAQGDARGERQRVVGAPLDAQVPRRQRQRPQPDLRIDAGDHPLVGGQRPGHGHQAGVEHAHHRGQHLPYRAPALLQQCPGPGVAVGCRSQQRRHRRQASPPGQRPAADHGLQAADAPALAGNCRVVGDRDVPDVPGRALRPAVDAAAGGQSRADPAADDHAHQVEHVGRGLQLAQRQQVGVVVDPGGSAEAGGESIAHRVAVPARHDRRRHRRAGNKLHRAGDAEPDAPQRRRPGLRGEQPGHRRLHLPEHPVRSPGQVDRGGPLRDHRPVEVAQGNPHRLRTQIGDQQRPGLGPEPQLARGAAAGRRAPVRILDQAGGLQQLQPLARCGATQPGLLDEAGARAGGAAADQVEHCARRGHLLARRAARAVHGSGL